MCAMALRLVLVFRPVSPLSGHSLAAGRRGGPTLFPNLGPVRHTSLELSRQKLFSLYYIICMYMHPSFLSRTTCNMKYNHSSITWPGSQQMLS